MTGAVEQHQRILDAIRREEFATALDLLQPLAESGDAVAQYQLGVMYANAEGVPLDYVQAAGWLRRAAEQGFSRAQSILAWLCATERSARRSTSMSSTCG